MSVRIGEVKIDSKADPFVPAVHVLASSGGIELHSDEKMTLSPIEARNYAALLVRAADEVERMRGR